MQIKAIVLSPSAELTNLNNKANPKWILVVAVKYRHRAIVLLLPKVWKTSRRQCAIACNWIVHFNSLSHHVLSSKNCFLCLFGKTEVLVPSTSSIISWRLCCNLRLTVQAIEAQLCCHCRDLTREVVCCRHFAFPFNFDFQDIKELVLFTANGKRECVPRDQIENLPWYKTTLWALSI